MDRRTEEDFELGKNRSILVVGCVWLGWRVLADWQKIWNQMGSRAEMAESLEWNENVWHAS